MDINIFLQMLKISFSIQVIQYEEKNALTCDTKGKLRKGSESQNKGYVRALMMNDNQ